MQVPGKQPKHWKEVLKFIGDCPVCNFKYSQEKINFLGDNGTTNIVHITCPKCSSHFMALITIMAQGLSTLGMITDLDVEDTKRLYNKKIINTDEMIGFHTFINNKGILEKNLKKYKKKTV